MPRRVSIVGRWTSVVSRWISVGGFFSQAGNQTDLGGVAPLSSLRRGICAATAGGGARTSLYSIRRKPQGGFPYSDTRPMKSSVKHTNIPGDGTATGAGPMKKALPILVASLWLLLVGGAMAFLAGYSNTPGTAGVAPARWPAESHIAHDSSRPTLLLLAHPHCPCTSATLGELELLMAQTQGKVNAHVVFICPDGLPEDWVKSDLWRKASAIPGVTVEIDNENVEARRFHVETSGEALLYGSDGWLLFAGGITLSRGHSGDNPGRTAITTLLNRGSTEASTTPVFGCSLFAANCLQPEMKCKP